MSTDQQNQDSGVDSASLSFDPAGEVDCSPEFNVTKPFSLRLMLWQNKLACLIVTSDFCLAKYMQVRQEPTGKALDYRLGL
jgi:hypothetical protein